MKIFPKWFYLLPMALALTACPDTTTDGGSSGSFSVALASKVKPGTTDIKADSLATAINSVKAGVAIDPAKAADTELEVWITDTTYFNNDGTPKHDDSSAPWQVLWDAYDPTAATNSVKTGYAAGAVTVSNSKTGTKADKPGRRKVQVGNDLLAKTGGAVVVYIYPSTVTLASGEWGVAAPQANIDQREASYTLTITQADALDLTAAKLHALTAHAASSFPALADITTPVPEATVSVASGGATPPAATATPPAATATLQTVGTPSAGHRVSFKRITITGAANLNGASWHIAGNNGSLGSTIQATSVEEGGPGGGMAVDAIPLTADVRADFTIVSGKNGQLTLTATDQYGQQATITVTLDDLVS